MLSLATGPKNLFRPYANRPFALAAIGAFLACVILDVVLILLVQAGPPDGKSTIFFFELALLLAGLVIFGTATVTSPTGMRGLLPFVFLLLAWHTGLQLSLSSTGALVVSAIDLLVPVAFVLIALDRLQTPAPRLWNLRPLLLPFVFFYVFCLWGLVLALLEHVGYVAMLSNMKSFVIYPLIAFIIPLCIQNWRTLYYAVGLQVLLVMERVLEGLRQGSSYQVHAHLANGAEVARVNGLFASANQYAMYVMTGALILLALSVGLGKRRIQFILIPALVGTWLALVLTLSRGAWLATGVGIAALVLLVNPRRAPLTLGVVVAVAGLVLLVHPSAADLVLLRSTSSDNSLGERVSYTTLGFTVIRHYPLGAGWGAYFRFLGTELVPNPRQLPWYHNDYLQLATEIGVLGLLVFGWIWLAVLRLGLTALRRTRDIYQHAVIAGLFITVVAMLVQAATDQFFWRSDIAPHIWIVAGLLLAAVNLTYNVRPRLSVRPVEVTEEADRAIA